MRCYQWNCHTQDERYHPRYTIETLISLIIRLVLGVPRSFFDFQDWEKFRKFRSLRFELNIQTADNCDKEGFIKLENYNI